MKKVGLILLLLGSVFALSAASISSPAATVNLIRNEVITKSELEAQVKLYKDNGVDATEAEVLESMINEKVFMQGAERDGFMLTSRDVDTIFAQQKATVEAQYGSTLTDEQFKAIVEEQYGTVEDYKEYIKSQSIINNYVSSQKADMLQNIAEPTDREIRSWYRQNQTNFSQPEILKVSVVAMNTGDDDTWNAQKLTMLQKVYEDITAGRITFEKAVETYSEDLESKAKGGEVGWLADNQSTRYTLGDDFVTTVMDMEVGDVSPVIITPNNYVIAKVTDYQAAKVLGLDDTVSPEATMTVREYVRQGLTYQNSQTAFVNAYQSLVNDLKAQAKINRIVK